MGVQLRISLPDQPGSLARVTQAIARSGADVLWVSVLESEGGRAIDDFGLRWPDNVDHRPLLDALARERGVEVISCRFSRRLLDGRADLDLLTYLLAVPQRGVEILVDMLPAAVEADWAELRSPDPESAALYCSGAPHDALAPADLPLRAIAGRTGESTWMRIPVPQLRAVLVIGRDLGPTFLRTEVSSAEGIITLALKTLAAALRDGAGASDLTAGLVPGQATRRTA
ncbi:MAG TPA: ACT domain-containing protein [Mycobacteriales bacterium]|nr:ACT domain-containing protein [Mycobacteriales bacterium]